MKKNLKKLFALLLVVVMVAAMFAGDVTVSNDITAMPAVTITVNEYGNIK